MSLSSTPVTVIPITKFATWLDSQPTLKRCQVVGITHCKNVNSSVFHEYLHIILQAPCSGRWIRILAERQKKQDQVIIGFWSWVPGPAYPPISNSSSSSGNEVPLPLLMRYTSFKPPMDLSDVTRKLVAVHKRHPKYNLLLYNCFWYADAVYVLLRGRRPSTQKWKWIKYVKYIKVWPCIKNAMRKAAKEFQERLQTSPLTGYPDNVLKAIVDRVIQEQDKEQDNETPDADTQLKQFEELDAAELDALNAFVNQGNEGEESEDQTIPEEVNPKIEDIMENDVLMKIMEHLQLDKPKNLDEPGIRKDFQEGMNDMREFTRVTLALDDDEKKRNLKEYKANVTDEPGSLSSKPRDCHPFIERLHAALKSTIGDLAPTDQEEADYQEALSIFVGGVFRDLSSSAA